MLEWLRFDVFLFGGGVFVTVTTGATGVGTGSGAGSGVAQAPSNRLSVTATIRLLIENSVEPDRRLQMPIAGLLVAMGNVQHARFVEVIADQL